MSNDNPNRKRHLNWAGGYNIRDLGGLPTNTGAETSFKAIVRSDFTNRLNTDGEQALWDYGIRTIIDVRSFREAEQYPSNFQQSKKFNLTYFNLPIEKYYPHVGKLINKAETRGEVYCIILDHYPDAIATVLRTIIQARPGGVLIHCHAGKDRTGIISALCLSLAGVPKALVAADYAESQTRLKPLYDELVQKVGGEENLGFWSKPTVTEEMMMLVLNHLEAKYDGVEKYLLSAGLASKEIKQLQDLLLPR